MDNMDISDPPRWPYAVSGVVAAAAGMAAGHLVAAWVNPPASPVLAVGSTVVDATPTPVKEWAVRQLGSADKPVLLVGVALVTLLVTAGIGLLSRRRPVLAGWLLALVAGLAGAAALTRPNALPQDALPALVAAGVGALTLVGLRRLVPRRAAPVRPAAPQPESHPAPTASRPESPLDHTAYAPGAPATPDRRRFLVGATGVTAGAALVGALGQRVGSGLVVPESITLPAAASPLPPLPTGLETTVPGVSAFATPVADFYRVDTALIIPRVDVASWRLEIDGEVDTPFSITYDELLAMPMVEDDITINCVSNEVGGPYIGSTRWLGVPVRGILERAGIRDGVDQILSTSTDGMTISTPVEALLDDRGAMVAVAMDGKPLSSKHGFPARLLTPGLYGYVGATKWLTRLTATTYAAQSAYWTDRGWAERAEVRTQSRIDTPGGRSSQPAGRVAVGGVAWSQADGGISEVEVRVDDGPWEKATLGPDAGTTYWRQWFIPWDAEPGPHTLTARASDGTGSAQTEREADPFPAGATGLHSVVVVVE